MGNMFKVAGKLSELFRVGSSPKDALSNLGALLVAIAGLIEVLIQVGWLSAKYQPLVAVLPQLAAVAGAAFIGVATGRDQNLNPPVKVHTTGGENG